MDLMLIMDRNNRKEIIGKLIMKTTVYIVTHKKTNLPVIEGLEPLLVGAGNHPEINCYDNKDNTGDNISEKNKNYCELTGYYWIWKNSKSDTVGICHYRRYFTKSFFSNREKYFLNAGDINEILKNKDIIVPQKNYYEHSILESVNIAPNKADMVELDKAIKLISPDYYDTYIQFVNGKSSYLYNMCIMKKEMFDAYCDWLFSILSFIESDYDISQEDAYRARLYGFLSERLLGVWINQNIEQSRIKQCRVIKTDESSLRNKLHEIKNIYRQFMGIICRN